MWPFKRKSPQPLSPGDMRSVPVDNPLDFRPDGSIRPGDPAYETMMRMMETGESMISTQRPDGTWSVEFVKPDKPE